MMKFFFAPGTCALASRIALEEAGATYEPVRIDFKSGQQRSAEYLKVNPKGRVPALVTGQGTLTETPAIMLYVAQTHPGAKLAPEDPFELGKAQAFNSYLCSTVHVAHAHRMRGARWVDADNTAALDAMKKKIPQTVGDCFELIERDMVAGPWVMGERYTMCDGYLFTLSQWLPGDGVDIARFPKVQAIAQRIKERPAVQRALAGET